LSYATDTSGVEDARPPRKKFEVKKRSFECVLWG
jgi:hypothetical protein